MNLHPILFAAATLILAGLAHAASAATFTDSGTFSTATWNEVILGGGDVVDTRMNSGGNPGDWLQLQTIPNGGPIVIGAYFNSGAIWNPSTQGAIGSLSMMVDVKAIQTLSAYHDGQGVAIALMQDGKYYGPGFAVTGDVQAWVSEMPWTNVTASNFALYSDTALGTLDYTMHPDFSSAGSLITLGLMIGNSGSSSISGTTIGYDNWSLTVNPASPVPLPATLPLLLSGLSALGFMGWRRKKAVA